MQDFQGKVAVITGAGRGIGRGIAFHCAKEGMKIVLTGIRVESLSKTAADLNAMGAKTLVVQADVSLLEDVEKLAEKSYEAFGAVHLLVNNAGVAGGPGSVWENTMDNWNWVMDVNFYGVLHGIKAFISRMIKQDAISHIVNVSSLSGLEEASWSYGVSKHAVVALTEALYHDLAENAPHIKTSVYCPGYVNTEFEQTDTDKRPRPARFNNNATRLPEEVRAGARDVFEQYGFSIEESARILFEGLRDDKLYIGPKAFQKQQPEILDLIRKRADNIVNERNPEHPIRRSSLNSS